MWPPSAHDHTRCKLADPPWMSPRSSDERPDGTLMEHEAVGDASCQAVSRQPYSNAHVAYRPRWASASSPTLGALCKLHMPCNEPSPLRVY